MTIIENSTELDLDRDIPDPAVLSLLEHDSDPWDDEEQFSECCGSPLYETETPICSYCREHCSTMTEADAARMIDNLEWTMDQYCKDHPDFDVAINGSKSELFIRPSDLIEYIDEKEVA